MRQAHAPRAAAEPGDERLVAPAEVEDDVTGSYFCAWVTMKFVRNDFPDPLAP